MALSFGLTKRILENFGVPFVFGGIVYAVTLYFTGWPQSAAITAAALTFLVVFGLSFAFTENRTASSLRAENKTLHTEVGNLGGNLATKDSELQKKGEEISALALRIKDGDEKIETGRVEAEALRRRSSELESQLEVAKSRETEFQKRESELLARIATAEAERAQTKAQAEANEKVLAGRISSLQGATKLPMPRVSVQGQKTGVFGFGPMEWTVILENAGDGPMKDIDVGIRIVQPQTQATPMVRLTVGGTPLRYTYGGLNKGEEFQMKLPISGTPATGTTLVGQMSYADSIDRSYTKPISLGLT